MKLKQMQEKLLTVVFLGNLQYLYSYLEASL